MKIEDIHLNDILDEINNNQSKGDSPNINYENIINTSSNFEFNNDINNFNSFKNNLSNVNVSEFDRVNEFSLDSNFKSHTIINTINSSDKSIKESREEVVNVLKKILEKKLNEENTNIYTYKEDIHENTRKDSYEKKTYDYSNDNNNDYYNDDTRVSKRYNTEENIDKYLDSQPYLTVKDYESYIKVKRFIITLISLWFVLFMFLGEGSEVEMNGVLVLVGGLFLVVYKNITTKEKITKAMKHEKLITAYKEIKFVNKGLLMIIFNILKTLLIVALLIDMISSNYYYSLLQFVIDLILYPIVTFGVVEVFFIIPEIIIFTIQKLIFKNKKPEEYDKISEQKNQNKKNTSLRKELNIVTYL